MVKVMQSSQEKTEIKKTLIVAIKFGFKWFIRGCNLCQVLLTLRKSSWNISSYFTNNRNIYNPTLQPSN